MASWHGYQGALQAARLMRAHGGLGALAEACAARAGLRPGHAIGGLAITQQTARHRALLICIEPGLWAGKSKSGFAILRAADRGWHA